MESCAAPPEDPPFGAYIHIPFCRTRCPYCDFVSNTITGGAPQEYIHALCTEILSFDGPKRLTSIFVGGGTPSLLAPDALRRVMDTLADVFNLDEPEISVEANPDDVSAVMAKNWRAIGVNRVSLGVQSFNNTTLRYLGRRHRAAKARRAVEIIANNFDNWNMDLIFGAPPSSAWTATLEASLAYNPPHIAVYGLTYEPTTPFGERTPAFDEDAMLALYEQAAAALTCYDHYEISNYARAGYQCRHNLLYWQNLEYVGFGPGAFSYLSGKRMRNTLNLREYMRNPGRKERVEMLSGREQRVETLIQHFRLREGISESYYQQRFGETVDAAFAEPIDALQQRGLLHRSRGRIYPSWEGFCLNNEIGLALVDASGAGAGE